MTLRYGSFVVAALAVALAGCAGTQVAKQDDCQSGPAWTCTVSGRCALPQMGDGLCAVGRADSITSESLGIETAATRARGEMARVIDTQVGSFTRAVQDSLSKSGVGEDSVQKVGSFSQNITKRTLNGVTIPKTYFNKETRTYYALATIDAKTFADALKGLKDAGNLSESTKKEIDRRADAIVDTWERETSKSQ